MIELKNKFSFFTVITTLIALVLGNLVVATDSGDACGSDWPKCNGTFFPNITDINILIEYSHRLFTTLLGLIILINAIMAWRLLKNTKTKWLPFLTVFFLILQSLVGGLNVLLKTPVGFTTFDVVISLLLLISIIYLHYALINRDSELPSRVTQFKNPAFLLLFFIMIETVIGAFFKHTRLSKLLYGNYNGELFINSIPLSRLTYSIHGIIGIAIIIAIIYLVFYAYRVNQYKVKSLILTFSVLLTTFFGFATKIYMLSPFTSSFHMIFNILTIAITASIAANSRYQNRYNQNL